MDNNLVSIKDYLWYWTLWRSYNDSSIQNLYFRG